VGNSTGYPITAEALCIIFGMVFFVRGIELVDRKDFIDKCAGLVLMVSNLVLVVINLREWWLTKLLAAAWRPHE
jgi:hypothetical protein